MNLVQSSIQELLSEIDTLIWLGCQRAALAGGWDTPTGWLVLLTFEAEKQGAL